jgi:hypothetical protein
MLDEQQLVEIGKRARKLPREQQKDVDDLLLAVRTLKAANQGEQLSEAELRFIKQSYEQEIKGACRNLKRVAEDLGKLIA